MRQQLDDLDMAGWAYVLAEYDDLLATLVEGRLSSRERTRHKRDFTAGVWVSLRGLNCTIEEAVADAKQYRDDHPHDLLAYLDRLDRGGR
jgi:hypothetical protein